MNTSTYLAQVNISDSLEIRIVTGPAKMDKLAQTTHHHINFNILGSVQYIYTL